MKKLFLPLALLGTMISANAQELPQPSPKAKLEQRVGLTDITIEYSRPGAKGRLVFPDVVPPNELWRTGANMNSTIEVSTPINIQGQTLPAGTYSIFTIPNDEMWQVMFNSKTDHSGTSGYSEDGNVVHAEAKATKLTEPVETFTIDVNDIRTESAAIVLTWQNTRVSLPFEVEVTDRAKENIETALNNSGEDEKWKVYRNAANYYHNNDMEAEKALEYINKSIEAKSDSWYSYWLKAEILAEKGDYKAAIKSAKESKKVGEDVAKESGASFDYSAMIDNGINAWKEKK